MRALKIPRLSAVTWIRRIALAYLIIWVLSPPLAYGDSWRVLAVLAMGLWLALEARSNRSVLLRPNLAVMASVTFVLYTVAIEWLVPDAATINKQFPIWIMLFFLLVGESFRRGRDGDARFCFWLILLVLPVWSLSTLSGLDTYGDHTVRIVTRSSAAAKELAEEGVGGFGLVYTMMLCLPFLAHLVLRPRGRLVGPSGRWMRRAAYGLIVINFMLGSVLILRAGYSIAVLLALLGVAIVVLVRSRHLLPITMSLCLCGLLVMAGYLVMGPTLDSLQQAAGGTEYSTKVRDIRASVEGGQNVGTVEGRTERYYRSIVLFIKNPLMGTLTIDDVGKHSAILDRFAQYGILIGLIFLYLLVYIPQAWVRDSRIPIGLALSFLAVGFGLPLLNNVFMSWGLILYVFSRGALAVMGVSLERGKNSAATRANIADA